MTIVHPYTDGSINRKHGIIERWVGWEETGEIKE